MSKALKKDDRELIARRALEAEGFELSYVVEPTEADELLGIPARLGQVCVVLKGERQNKVISGNSFTDCNQQAERWLEHQARLKEGFQFRRGDGVTPIIQRVSGDLASTRARRETTERRVVSLDGGTPHLVDAHGDPIHGDTNRASQLA